ncbi:hypothetical protein [Mycetocola saprophilus]|uniref:hypothetical protein n=1 Tax=Mycetocola saprophilus TaxID=76636 RepID=UPI0004C1B53E|nr:hypothetical protein [Mycetocola saprophilus]
MSVVFDSLVASVVPKLDAILKARPEPCASGVTVANKVLPVKDRRSGFKDRMVAVFQGPGAGDYDTLDDTTLRVRVICKGEFDAEDLAHLVKALFEDAWGRGLVDGDPIVRCKVSAGPVEVVAAAEGFEWYMVANVTRRGTDFR